MYSISDGIAYVILDMFAIIVLTGVNERAWEIILWLAFKTKPKQKLVSFPLFH